VSSERVSIDRIGRGKRDLERFFDVADPLYAGDPNWVPPLRSDVAKVFQDENPFFRHGEMQLFVARRAGLSDAEMDDFLGGLTDEEQKQALERANRLR